MAVAWSTSASHSLEWKWWPNREAATHREQTAVGTYSAHAMSVSGDTLCAKRRAPTWKEQTASAGAYTAKNLVWLAPAAAFSVTPKAGDQIRDGSSVDHTVLEATLGKWGLTWRLVTIALALVEGLRSTCDVLRPDDTARADGKRSPTWLTPYSDVPCRVQEVTAAREGATAGGVSARRRFAVYLGQQLALREGDVLEVDSVRYDFVSAESFSRLDQLYVANAERVET